MLKSKSRVTLVISLFLLLLVPAFIVYAGGGKEVKRLQKELDACQVERGKLESENPGLKSQVDLLTAQVSDLEAEKADLEAEIADLEAQIAEKDAMIDSLIAESGDVSVVSRTVEQRIQMQDAEIIELKQEKNDLEDENSALKRDLREFQSELEQLRSEGESGYMDAEALQAENEELAAQVEELKAESDDRAGQIEQLEEEKAALEARVEELQGAVDELEAALMVYEGIERTTKVLMETAFDRIQEALQEEIDAGKVEVFKGALGIVVDIHGEYMFDVGKVVINQTGKIILDKIAPILGELDGYFIGVVGNADSKQIVTPALKKRFGTNWELSAHRGAIVVRELIEKGNLPPAKMIAMGFGEFQPIEDNATVDGRGKNRRIDIVLMPIDVYAATVVGTQIR